MNQGEGTPETPVRTPDGWGAIEGGANGVVVPEARPENGTSDHAVVEPKNVRSPRIFEREPVRLVQIDGAKESEGETTAFSESGAGIRIKLKVGEKPERGEIYEVLFLSPRYACIPVEGEIVACEDTRDPRFDVFVRMKWTENGVNEFSVQLFRDASKQYIQSLSIPGKVFTAELVGPRRLKISVETVWPGGVVIRMPIAEDFMRVGFGVLLSHRVLGEFSLAPVRVRSCSPDPKDPAFWYCHVEYLGDTAKSREYFNAILLHESRVLGDKRIGADVPPPA